MLILKLCFHFLLVLTIQGQCRVSFSQIFSEIEQLEGIPRNLLEAISICESSKNFKNLIPPYPWAVSCNSKANYFQTKKEAVEYVKKLQNCGINNIDVGCMQVNLFYHGQAFDSLENALDPITNIRYAAQFLKKLRESSESWKMALSRYHSYNQECGDKYVEKVIVIWKGLRERLCSKHKLLTCKNRLLNKNISNPNVDKSIQNKSIAKISELLRNVVYSSNFCDSEDKFL